MLRTNQGRNGEEHEKMEVDEGFPRRVGEVVVVARRLFIGFEVVQRYARVELVKSAH